MKRIMKEFKIDEISAVDRPAQTHAKMALMKRMDGAVLEIEEEDEEEEEMEDEEGDMEVTLKLKPKKGEKMDAFVSRFMGDETMGKEYPDEKQRLAVAYSMFRQKPKAKKNHSPNDPAVEVSKDIAGENAAEDIGTAHEESMSEIAKAQDALKAAEQKIADLQKQLSRATQLSSFSDLEKNMFKGMSDAEQENFLSLRADQRAEIIKRAEDANPVVYTTLDGTSYRKSDDSRLVQIAKAYDETKKALAEQVEKNLAASYTKRAAEELTNLPGDESVRVSLLKAVDSITDEAVRAKVTESLRAASGNLAKAFTTVGHRSPVASNAETKLDELAKAHAAKTNLSFAKAYDEVLRTEEGRKLYAQFSDENAKSV